MADADALHRARHLLMTRLTCLVRLGFVFGLNAKGYAEAQGYDLYPHSNGGNLYPLLESSNVCRASYPYAVPACAAASPAAAVFAARHDQTARGPRAEYRR